MKTVKGKVYLLKEDIDLGYRVLYVFSSKEDAVKKRRDLEAKRRDDYVRFMLENNRNPLKPDSSDKYCLEKSDYSVLEFDVI